ncbi:uncharacterized protein CTRU02_201199 [Colletotrichum truncatum]|uniref:Uncharacterized protein n=1 Tax=Colletotrichum truncatum TaxID=5467 RepID=A0ACC3ZGN7_COLTU|nr:uncharacterized protein CTRU02_07985 [Colletotrichum truncatum]KAF6790465.1 hypothetical protein CTRU02_07985 [Colletotrichum truncatum]
MSRRRHTTSRGKASSCGFGRPLKPTLPLSAAVYLFYGACCLLSRLHSLALVNQPLARQRSRSKGMAT